TTFTPPQIVDRKSNPQAFVDATASVTQPIQYLEPLSSSSKTNVGTFTMNQSRYDLAATSIDDFRGRLNAWLTKTSGNPATDNWWGVLFCNRRQRFQANPFIENPITANNFAQQAPIFLPGCTQFIVKSAGDFVAQNPANGAVTNVYTNANGTDGQIDY